MPNESNRLYWDACCFLHYLNQEVNYIDTLDRLLIGASNSDGTLVIVTSIISKVEVAFVTQEQVKRTLSSDEERKIDQMWGDTSAILLTELHDSIALEARRLIRDATTQKPTLVLKPADAIHLATAIHLNVAEFQTYDPKLLNPAYAAMAGIKIGQPSTLWVPYHS